MAEEEEPQARIVISRDLGSQLIFVSAEPALASQRGWEFLGSPPPLHCCLQPRLRGAKRERRLHKQTQRRRKHRPEATLGRRKDFTNKFREHAIRHVQEVTWDKQTYLSKVLWTRGWEKGGSRHGNKAGPSRSRDRRCQCRLEASCMCDSAS